VADAYADPPRDVHDTVVNLTEFLPAASGLADPRATFRASLQPARRMLAPEPAPAARSQEDALLAKAYFLAIIEGPPAEAEVAFRRTLSSNPFRLEAITGLPRFILSAREGFAEAQPVLAHRDPKAPSPVIVKRWVHFWQSRFEEAFQYARKALKHNPQDPNGYLLLGRCCAALG
jgi:tetratricopeptide (TPR) repeat protein